MHAFQRRCKSVMDCIICGWTQLEPEGTSIPKFNCILMDWVGDDLLLRDSLSWCCPFPEKMTYLHAPAAPFQQKA